MNLPFLSKFNRALNEIQRLHRQYRTLEIDAINLKERNGQLERQLRSLSERNEHLAHELREERRISRELLDEAARDLADAREAALLSDILRKDLAA